ncbi:hypothetical protein [Nocardia cyriacigeorgica]|uniref:hypothetical protein n=1 Tax=Nocardia cyriacigeorgica TaxID=135487 RepID=UPI002454863F|nr:hypothetical protein [Nocardia cyriacigeorgica]
MTEQDVYFARLWWLRRNGTADDVARFAAAGPPPPVAADGYWGALAYYEFHAPSDARCAMRDAPGSMPGFVPKARRDCPVVFGRVVSDGGVVDVRMFRRVALASACIVAAGLWWPVDIPDGRSVADIRRRLAWEERESGMDYAMWPEGFPLDAWCSRSDQ